MALLKTSMIRKKILFLVTATLFLVAAIFSVSALVAESNQPHPYAIIFDSVQRDANQGDAEAQNFLGTMYCLALE